MNNELIALKNAANRLNIVVHEIQFQDKRRTKKQYYATHNGKTVSPRLDYENLNHFILGWIKAAEHIKNKLNEK